MNKKLKVLTVFGTRPEAIKMSPLVLELRKRKAEIDSYVAVTGQHRQMLDQVLDVFNVRPDFDLNIMKERQTLVEVTTNALVGLDETMKQLRPDVVLVHGDTTTTFVASLAAFYNQITIGHVEAGLRTFNKYSPFPEEANRMLTGVLADLHFAPTEQAANHLRAEGKDEASIYVTGNTAIDALKTTVSDSFTHEVLTKVKGKRLVLLTAHRRENLGEPMKRIFRAVRKLVDTHEDVAVVYPVHLNPAVQEVAHDVLGGHERIHLIEPLGVVEFHNFAARAEIILTDSGGIQEEAPSLGKPVLVLRDTTERPEGIKAGTLKLAGTDEDTIFQMAHELLTDEALYQAMAQAKNPYGDGEASRRIVDALLYHFGYRSTRPDRFVP